MIRDCCSKMIFLLIFTNGIFSEELKTWKYRNHNVQSAARQAKDEKRKLGRWAKKEGLNMENYREKTFEDEGYLRTYFETKIEKLRLKQKKEIKDQKKQTLKEEVA